MGLRRTLAIVAVFVLVLVACSQLVPFPDPEEPAFITDLTQNPRPTLAETLPPGCEAHCLDGECDVVCEATKTPVPPTLTPTPTQTPIPMFEYTGIIMGGDADARRPERNQFGVRSDVFIIYHFEHWPTFPSMNRLYLISLPRDLWLQVPCSPLDPELEGNDRVNAAWAYGQFECVAQMVETNFNLIVNAPMAFTDMDGFMWLVSRLGAVRVVASETYTDWCGNYHGTDGDHGNYVTWYEGQEYSMGPNEALCYVRARQGASNGDLDRNRRGLDFIQALGEQYAAHLFDTWDPANVASEIFAFMVTGHRYIDLDMEVAHAVDFAPIVGEAATAPRVFIRWTLEETEFYTTPIYGASVLRPLVGPAGWLDCMQSKGTSPSEPEGLEALRQICTERWLIDSDA